MGVPRRPNPTKFVSGSNKSKQMGVSFFAKNGHVAIVPLKERKTVNHLITWSIQIRKEEQTMHAHVFQHKPKHRDVSSAV